MSQLLSKPNLGHQARSDQTAAAVNLSIREALLEHARMGRSVPGDELGKWMAPAEIFARYGFDEHGQPLTK